MPVGRGDEVLGRGALDGHRRTPGAQHRTAALAGLHLDQGGGGVALAGPESGDGLGERGRARSGEFGAVTALLVGVADGGAGPRPALQVTAVEAGVLQPGPLPPVGRCLLRRPVGVEDVGLSGGGGQRDLPVGGADGRDLLAAVVGQLVEGVRALAGHLPGAGSAGLAVVVELLAVVPRQQVVGAAEHLAALVVEGPLPVLDSAAHPAGEGDVVAVPAGDPLLLEVLRGQVLLPDVGGEGVPVGLSGPALEVLQGGLAEDRVVVPDVLLAVADEPDDLRVQALVGGPAVVQVVGPVRPERGALELVGPFGADGPALLLYGLDRLVGDPAVAVVDVDVEEVEVLVGLVAQLLEALFQVAAVDVAALVDVVALVEPVPAGLGLVDELLGEGVGLRVGLGGVDVDAEVGAPLLAVLEQGVEVLQPMRPACCSCRRSPGGRSRGPRSRTP